jgi:NAD(P)-dependent dehydrogenase (short-subunit alcohol dehydrogenase family)
MKIFCTGASGYIGGSVAAHLVASGHQVTGLVRSPEKADAVRAFGIEPVMGTLDDVQILARAAQAADAAAGRDIRVGGGVSTIRQYLRSGLIDELHFAMRPVLLGEGESLLNGIDMRALGYECAETIPGPRATHVILRKKN